MVVYTKNHPEVLTSIRFAANTIFGDGYNSNPALNGFVQKYSERFKDLGIVSYYLPKLQRSEDIAGFFFSLENNRDLQKRNTDASFAKELHQDADFRIVFLVFYSAIIYHLAKLMKAKGLEAPAYITFSGTGSKVIDFADPRPRLKGLTKLTEAIFEKVSTFSNQTFDSESPSAINASPSSNASTSADASAVPPLNSDSGNSHPMKSAKPVDTKEPATIELKQYENPKEITCKGGLMIDQEIDIEDIKSVLLGDTGNRLLENEPLDYNSISEATNNSVLTEYQHFIDSFFSLHKQMNFSNEFGVNPTTIAIAKKALTTKAKEYLLLGIEQQLSELNEDKTVNIAESLFFYPLVGGLNKLAYDIYANEE